MDTIFLKSTGIFKTLYRWFFNSLPNKTCNYYGGWFMLILLIIPYSIVALPAMLFEIYKPFRLKQSMVRFKQGFFLYFVMAIITITLFVTRIYFVEMTEFLASELHVQIIIVILNILFLILSIMLTSFTIIDYRKLYKKHRRKLGKEIKPLLIVKWYKALKYKLCKNIEWS